jgi:formate-dependent nitrite reductase membrane component NrfD
MILLRTFMVIFILLINCLVWDIENQTRNTSSALGGGFYILGYFALSIITTIIIAYLTNFKKFRKVDYALFVLCTPISSIVTILLLR